MCATLVVTVFATATSGSSEHWTLSTGDTYITVNVTNNQPVIWRLFSAMGGHSWAFNMRVPLMAVARVDDRECQVYWRFIAGKFDRDAGQLVLTFTASEPRLVLWSIWRARPGGGPVEHWIEIENRSGKRVTLSHQDSLVLQGLDIGREAKLWWVQRGGSNASTQGGTHVEPLTGGREVVLTSNCEDGASPVPWMAIQVTPQPGLYVGWEFSGLGRIRAKVSPDATRLDLNVGLKPDFKTDIGPGETFLVPPAFVGCFDGDVDEGSYSLHRFVLEKLRPGVPEGFADPTLAYNLYLDAGGDKAKEADVLRSAAFCHDLGFETFMPDAMWFPECGDWRWDPKRFPSGVTPIEQFVHGHGMKLALWCAWTNGGISSDPGALSVRGHLGHPDWFSGDFAPNWKPAAFSGGQICLACPEAKQWAIAKTQWLVGNHKLDYLKHDCGPIVNNCNKKTHRHGYGVDASYWATMGYYEVQEKLRKAFPNVILEDCSGGGHIKDYGVIRRTHYIVTTDTLSNLPDRQSIYDSTFAMPPVVLQAYTYDNAYPVKGDNPGTFLWRSAMMGAWQVDPTDTIKWTEEEKDSAKRSVEIYKRWVRPMLKDVKVHHILPRPDGVHWDGMFYWSPSLKRGTLYIFRPESKDEQRTVKLKGLVPSEKHWLWCEDGSIEPGERMGHDLMGGGLTIRLPAPYTSDLIYVQDATLGKPEGLTAPGEFRLLSATTESNPFTVSAKLSWESSANARAYEVVVAESADFQRVVARASAIGTSATISGLPPSHDLHWKVEAISYAGRHRNAGGSGTLTTPKLKELTGVVFVSDMPWVKSTAGADNKARRDTNYYGRPIRIAGKTFPKGVWTHSFNDAAPADVVLDIAGKGFATFAAEAGVEDAANGGSVQFQVLVDGQMKAESPVMRAGAAHSFRVEVGGAKQTTLRVLNGGDGFGCDHAAWGIARFIKAGAADPLK
jgi:alpha-galactosidase